ncbi:MULTISPECIES: L-dopachrome tautomerase-related protein [Pantoea]|uniref:L-dopachrome tautomerase-related protein n=1 Tax=Pantoea TaxID=53335 RepID=UPI00080B122E|nr:MULTISPECIES: L-dopachrome tautomerase-related protein [Pantoea]MDU6080162.1 L-dopachrome tautomerase-related protein [Pantoea sp.]
MRKKLFFCAVSASLFLIQPATANTKPEVVASINPPYPDPSGIAVSSSNRVFLGFPRHADNHNWYSLAEVKGNKLVPYPDNTLGLKNKHDYDHWLVSPHGMYMDKNDVLWVLDDGKIAGNKEIPEGAAKVVAIDTKSNKVIHNIVIHKPVLNSGSHYNDLRVDLTHGDQGEIYIANSGFEQHYSLVIIDIASGKQREVLTNHYSTSPEPGYIAFLEGQPHQYDFNHQSFPLGGADGVSLSPDSKKLYWTVLNGRNLYSIDTAVLSDFSKNEKAIEAAVHFEGQHPANDGLAEDSAGNLYFGAYEQQSLIKRDAKGNYSLLSHDEKNYVWPDGLAYKNGFLYATLGQWNRLAELNDGKDLRRPPYLVVKVKVQ